MSAPPVLVIDASVLIDALSTTGETGDRARKAVAGARLAAPEHLYVEALHGIRGRLLGGKLGAGAAERALDRVERMTVEVVPTKLLLRRMWQLRDNLTGYDAAYVAAAEQLDAPLVTGDKRLAVASGPRCQIVLA